MADALNKPGTAAVLSFVFSGLGQLYNGQIKKGLVIIFISSLNLLVFSIGSVLIALWLKEKVFSVKYLWLGILLSFTALISICNLGIYSIFDAHRSALKK